MELVTVLKNQKREIVKLSKGDQYSYAWLENNTLTMNNPQFQPEESKLILTKEELQTSFPNFEINTETQTVYNGNRIVSEKCYLIQ
jgi:hypothetical protein